MSPAIESGERLFPVISAIELETGCRPHKGSAYRWMLKGARNVRLPFKMLGGRRVTSLEAVRRWVDAVTAAGNSSAPSSHTPREHECEIDGAERRLADNGW